MSDGAPADEPGTRCEECDDRPVDLGPPQASLVGRLNAGVGPIADSDRAAHAVGNDCAAWKDPGLRKVLRSLYNSQRSSSLLPGLPGARRDLADLLADPGSEHIVRALLYNPGRLLEVMLPNLLLSKGATVSESQALRMWAVLSVCVETLWEHVTGEGGAAHRHLAPLAARTRFLALSEPFRHQGTETWQKWWKVETLKKVFGHSHTWVPLVRRAREARDVWRGHLDRYQSLPLFDHAPPSAVEEEIRWLAFQEPARQHVFSEGGRFQFTTRVYSGGPLPLSEPIPRGSDTDQEVKPPEPNAADRALLGETVERHLLPRFAVLASWSAVLGLYQHPRYKGALRMYWLLLLSLIAALGLVASALWTNWITIPQSLIGIAVFYGVIGAGSLFLGRVWAMPLLLRLPAAGAVGLIILVAFHPSWWERATTGWLLPTVLGGAALGYLLIETRNHNTGSAARDWTAPLILAGRALAVAATGLVHSLFVAVVGMVAVTTVFGEGGDELLKVWEGTLTDGDPVAILLAATFWCLAAGVFSQILWDDQPITAPLSHRRWRDER
ncbi:hypothetical protein [Nocardiopsis valliformis]|uniref:hypothetical protein n=1 Tax=Nocardiopsis valliformis TaxID=239974 RepID=UPI000346863C|nr:hypothetical protein [Nocardiopsis valliformis]